MVISGKKHGTYGDLLEKYGKYIEHMVIYWKIYGKYIEHMVIYWKIYGKYIEHMVIYWKNMGNIW